jgi:hypothetical protein
LKLKIKNTLTTHPLDTWMLSSRYKNLIFLLGLIIITMWQSSYYIMDTKVNPEYRRADATGFNHYWGQEFVYFYYYKGLFPLASTESNKTYSKQGADNLIKNNPTSLRMEWGHWSRFGESARIWLYLPYAIWKGSAEKPEIIFSNYLLFTLSLFLLWLVCWKIQKPFLGLLMVLIIGFSPFMIYEIYNNNNVFGLMAVYVMLLFALHLPFIFNKNSKWIYTIALTSGVLAGIMHQIRAESLPIIVSCILVYLLNSSIKLHKRLIPIAILLIAFVTTGKIIHSHFEKLYKETREIVVEAGAIPFDGGKTLVHPFWHPIYCGLGDYDTKYGHVLHDSAVYNYALPILREQTGKELKYPGRTIYEMAEYYDTDSLYYMKVETIEGFDEIVKNKFIEVISNDPIWYAGIVTKRIRDFFFQLSPIGITLNNKVLELPFSGLFFIMLILLLFYLKEFEWLKMLAFTLPLGTSVVLIYSAYNNSYQSIFHLFTFAAILYLFIGLTIAFKQKNGTKAS